MDAYLELVRKSKNERITFLLSQTDTYLSSLSTLVGSQKDSNARFEQEAEERAALLAEKAAKERERKGRKRAAEGGGEAEKAAAVAVKKGEVADADCKLELVRKALRERLVRQSTAVADRARNCEERLCLHKKKCACEWDLLEFEGKDVPNFMEAQEEIYPAVEKAVLACLVRACKAVDACAGLKKLEECVAALEVSQIFDCNQCPQHIDRDADILAHLGASQVHFLIATPLIAGWRSYVAAWKKPAEPLNPRAVCAFWRAYASGPNASLSALGRLAIKEFSRPISSACCERIFSYLTHMDTSDRQTMSKELLTRLLFLRGNWRLVQDMVAEERSADVVLRHEGNERRKRQRAAVGRAEGEAQQAAAAEAAAAVAALDSQEEE
jgi:hypothetical protein